MEHNFIQESIFHKWLVIKLQKSYFAIFRQKSVINFEFKFDHVFNDTTPQEAVFNKAAVNVVEGASPWRH